MFFKRINGAADGINDAVGKPVSQRNAGHWRRRLSVLSALILALSAFWVTPAYAEGSRGADHMLHLAGARIRVGERNDCTSGFAVKSLGGARYQVMPAHCLNGTSGRGVRNGAGNAWGTGVKRVSSVRDAALFDSNYRQATWIGPTWSTQNKSNYGWQEPYSGQRDVCFSGATSGEICGFTIVAGRHNNPNKNPPATNEVLMYSPSAWAQSGDSGAPVYYHYGAGRVILLGMLTGNSTDSCCTYVRFLSVLDIMSGFDVSFG